MPNFADKSAPRCKIYWNWYGASKCRKGLLRVVLFSVFIVFLYHLLEYHNHPTISKSSTNITLWWNLMENETANHLAPNAVERQPKLILVWTDFFDVKDWLPSPKKLNCPVRDCEVTRNRSLMDHSSALVFHLMDVHLDDLPPDRRVQDPPGPPWVLLNQEAPPHTPGDALRALRRRVHWTISYRRDSSIYSPYGRILKRREPYLAPERNANRNSVCWLVSNCRTASERESFVEAMSQHIIVHIYGKCSEMKCPMDSKPDCYRWLAQRCKFYLSFENSICKDYATEKLFLALANDMVPVVLGGADYMGMLPAGSYVDAADFAGPRELAWYLDSLGNDTDRYASHFLWKRDYESEMLDVSRSWLCDLCQKLHEGERLKLHEDLVSWWYDGSPCRSWLTGHEELSF